MSKRGAYFMAQIAPFPEHACSLARSDEVGTQHTGPSRRQGPDSDADVDNMRRQIADLQACVATMEQQQQQ